MWNTERCLKVIFFHRLSHDSFPQLSVSFLFFFLCIELCFYMSWCSTMMWLFNFLWGESYVLENHDRVYFYHYFWPSKEKRVFTCLSFKSQLHYLLKVWFMLSPGSKCLMASAHGGPSYKGSLFFTCWFSLLEANIVWHKPIRCIVAMYIWHLTELFFLSL